MLLSAYCVVVGWSNNGHVNASRDYCISATIRAALRTPDELYLIGGAALCLLGNPRTTLDLDFVGNDLPTAAERTLGTLRGELEKLADELQIEVEAVPLEQFIPVPLDAHLRHCLIGQFGALQVFVFDPYSIALSKLDRGLPTDLQDIEFLLQQGVIERSQLAVVLEQALTQAVEFGLNRSEARIRLSQLRT